MSKSRTPSTPKFDAAAKRMFLSDLSMTCNVTRSARAAGVHTALIYEERKHCADFRAAYGEALTEGYVRVEAELLADAIRPVRAPKSALAAKERERVQRLRLNLLNAHRATVREQADVDSEQQLQRSAKEELIARLDEMADRLSDEQDDQRP